MGSSVTDTEAYRAVCLRAATDPEAFATFRDDPVYAPVVAISPEIGQECLARANPEIAALIPQDDPTFCRYAWQLTRMLDLFGPLKGMRVLEIGGGFGGMAWLLSTYCEPASYTIVDLPEVTRLQRRWLSQKREIGERLGVSWIPSDSPRERGPEVDLLISTWAFSELVPDWQRHYAKLYLAHAKRGYMECNFVQHCLGPDAVQALVPGSVWIPDDPPTHPLNRTLVWGLRDAQR